MPIMLTRKDGPPTPFRNAEYIPFYYFIPKSILSRCGAELNAIPRNPQVLLRNRAACEFVESDLFRLLIIDATAFMVWPYMGFGEYMEIYSGYDPAWRFAHCPDYWIQELTDEGILASAGELFKGCHSELGYVPEWQIDIYLRYIVPNVMKKHRMDEIIRVAREYPCFEDFDFRKSNQKTDFIRKWYHTRTKHPMISLEEFQEAYADAHGGQEYEEPDPSQNVEETAVAQALVDQFKAMFRKVQEDFHQLSEEEQRADMGQYTARHQEEMLDYIYDHFDVFRLLLDGAHGTRFSCFLDELVDIEVEYTYKYMEVIGCESVKSGLVTEEFIHIIVTAYFNGMFEVVRHNMDRAAAHRYVKMLNRYHMAGFSTVFDPQS